MYRFWRHLGPQNVALNLLNFTCHPEPLLQYPAHAPKSKYCNIFQARNSQERNCGDNFYDRAKFWAKNWAKNWAKFWTKFSGHFRASLAVQNDPPKFLPKLLPIYHSTSWHSSRDWNLKISSPRASGAWGAQHFSGKKSQDHFFTPNPQICRFYFLNLAQKEKSLLRKPDSPH